MEWGSSPPYYLELVKKAGHPGSTEQDRTQLAIHSSVIRAGQWVTAQAYASRWSMVEWMRKRDVALLHVRQGRFRPSMMAKRGERLLFVITDRDDKGVERAGGVPRVRRRFLADPES